MSENNQRSESQRVEIQKSSDSSKVAVTFIKYTAYTLMFFGFLYFIVRYIIPFFN